MSLDPNKTYLVWNGTEFPNSTNAQFKAPAGSTIDWGDGTVETFDTASTTVNTHTYTDGKTEHTIAISGLTSIGNSAFDNCTRLASITIPDSVTSINYRAFYYCTSLTSMTIGSGVTSIGNYAFEHCYKLIEVKNLSTLGISAGSSSYGYVGYYAKRVYTEGESYLSTDKDGYLIYDDGTNKILVAYTGTETDLTLPSDITQINQYAFSDCTSLTSVTIPNSVKSIGDWAFSDCSSLTSVTIPNSVTSIGSSAFSDCTSLTSVTIPDSVTSIGRYAFSGCSSLTSVTIPDSVTSIGNGAFYHCTSLTQLILFPSTPPTLGSNAIPTTVQSIYVQQSSKAAYQAATNWTTFASKIVSDNIYLSFVRFNQKNKEYIDKKLTSALSEFGGKLYKHMLNIKKSSGEFFVLTFLSPTSIAITNATLIDNDNNWILGATGFSSTGFACICVSLMSESGLVLFGNGNTIQILYSEVTNITDTVIQP